MRDTVTQEHSNACGEPQGLSVNGLHIHGTRIVA